MTGDADAKNIAETAERETGIHTQHYHGGRGVGLQN